MLRHDQHAHNGQIAAMKVLLAIDGSGHSDAAIDAVVNRQLQAGSEVRVISVVEATYFPAAFPGDGGDVTLFLEIERAARERARAAVDAAAATLRAEGGNRGVRVTADVFSGSAKRTILEEADAFGADIIVVGSHGHGHLERFRLGSVSHAVALNANCSVEIVRRPAR